MYFIKGFYQTNTIYKTLLVSVFFKTAQGLSLCILKGPGGGVLGLIFTGYVPLASKSPYSPLQSILWPIMEPILVTFGQIYNPHSHFTRNYCFLPVASGKRLLGMCHQMGSHFHDWIDYIGVAFSIELLEWGRTFSDFWG